eukprot:TRINITY_DN33462_c0_g1_i1.p1 TRINITY_DN33462_c0_g1~~TRINITY_DN33462_c0_g1_i1.p1  ORF type:complete len:321 (+),score=48.30 TRINITY_DN33462_c0_g1_i1:215-1177(+)
MSATEYMSVADVDYGPKGWTPDRVGSLKDRTYVITGANAGTGFEAARVFLSKGAQVVMLNRSAERSAEAIARLQSEFGARAPASFVRMDLAVQASVRNAATEVLAKVPRIDALICNAAIAQVATQEITVDGFESQLGVNHFGHFLLCGMLYSRIEASDGRIVVVGSNAYKMGLKRIKFEDLNFDQNYSGWDSYAQSKLAQLIFAYELQRRLQESSKRVQVHVCHPGASRTNLIQGKTSRMTKFMWAIMSPFAQSAERGSWPEVMCAVQDGLRPRMLHGPTRCEMVGPIRPTPVEAIALDREAAQQLWTLSEEKTGYKWSI